MKARERLDVRNAIARARAMARSIRVDGVPAGLDSKTVANALDDVATAVEKMLAAIAPTRPPTKRKR